MELLDFLCNGRQVAIDLFFQQTALLGVVAFGLGGKLQPFEPGVLIDQLLIECPLVAQLAQQPLGHLAQLRGVQFCQRLLIHHHGQ